MKTGGWFRIRSGRTEILWKPPDPAPQYFEASQDQIFYGTIVDVQLPYKAEVDVGAILTEATVSPSFPHVTYSPVDIIENRHMSDDGRFLVLRMAEETKGFGSRMTGEQIRVKALYLLNAESGIPLLIDWKGVQMVASSYADEFIGKLFFNLGPVGFMSRVKMVNLEPIVQTLVNNAIVNRLRRIGGNS